MKTKIVYCKDANRPGSYEHTSFDFPGYTFRGRLARGPRGCFTGFSPAISAKAKTAKGRQIRAWHLGRRSGTDLSGLAEAINPQVRPRARRTGIAGYIPGPAGHRPGQSR